ncbi:MAG: hypothetical protein WA951_10350 [Leeuwenhoekiella sp.]
MRTFVLILIIVVFTACNNSVTVNRFLALDSSIEKLNDKSELLVKDWRPYQHLEQDLKLICNTNLLNAPSYRKALLEDVKSMRSNLPNSIKTKKIRDSLRLLSMEIASFCTHVEDDEMDQRVVEGHVQDIMEAFGNFNHSLNQNPAYHK